MDLKEKFQEIKNNSKFNFQQIDLIIEYIEEYQEIIFVLSNNKSRFYSEDNNIVNDLSEKLTNFLKEFLNQNSWNVSSASSLEGKENYFLSKIKDMRKNIILGNANQRLLLEYLLTKFSMAGVSDLYDKFKNNIKNIEEEGADFLKRIHKLDEEIPSKLRETLAQQRSEKFKEKAEVFDDISKSWKKWVYIAIGFLVSIIAAALWSEFVFNAEIGKLGINFSITKVVLISIFAWLVLFFNKNYSVNKNLSYVYEQKYTMLETYLLFINTIEDKEIKNKVAAEIGKVIFEIVDTGYIKTQNDSSPTLYGQIENIMKTVKQ